MSDMPEGCIKLKPLRVDMGTYVDTDGKEFNVWFDIPNPYYNAERNEIIAVSYDETDSKKLQFVDDIEPVDDRALINVSLKDSIKPIFV